MSLNRPQVIVIIPGVMGSVLSLGDEVIWPGGMDEYFLSYRKLEKLLSSDVQATDILRQVSLSTQYGALVSTLSECGYSESGTRPNLYVCAYDWRKDIRKSAERLYDLISKIVSNHGQSVEISIIAHSMGGLVARYYLESGEFSNKSEWRAIKSLMTVGTPHLGAPIALTSAIGLEGRAFLSAEQLKIIANDTRYPALYQLLPHPDTYFATLSDSNSFLSPTNPYDEGTVYFANGAKVSLNKQNIEAASHLWCSLAVTKKPPHVRYVFVYGVGLPTATSSVLGFRSQGESSYAELQHSILPEGGDGTVPVWSASQMGVQNIAVRGRHDKLYRANDFIRVLHAFIGRSPRRSVDIAVAELSVEEQVVLASRAFEVVIDFSCPQGFDGTLVIHKLANSNGDPVNEKPVEKSVSIHQEIQTHQIRIIDAAPGVPGLYAVVLYDSNNRKIASDDIFVQVPANE